MIAGDGRYDSPGRYNAENSFFNVNPFTSRLLRFLLSVFSTIYSHKKNPQSLGSSQVYGTCPLMMILPIYIFVGVIKWKDGGFSC